MKSIFILLLFSFTSAVYAQKNLDKIAFLCPFDSSNTVSWYRAKNGNSGLISKDSTIITEPKFAYIGSIYGGIAEAGILKKGKMMRGFIDLKGNNIIPFVYDNVYRSGQVFIVEKNKKQGLLDTTNKSILPLQYDLIREYEPFFIVVKNNKIALYNPSKGFVSKFIFDDLYQRFPPDYIEMRRGDECQLINKDGIIISHPTNGESIEEVKDSLIIVKSKSGNSASVRMLDGKEIFPSQYENISFENNLLKVRKGEKKGIIDYHNKIIIPIVYDGIYSFLNDFYIVWNKKEAHYGVYQNDKLVLPVQYTDIQSFETNYLLVKNKMGLNGLYGKNMEVVLPEEYKMYQHNESFLLAGKGKELSIINIEKKSTKSLDSSYQLPDRNLIFFEQQKYFVLKSHDKYGAIDTAGNEVVPFEYENLNPIYSSSDFIAKKNGKFGIITTKNIILRPIQYDRAELIKEVVILYQNNKKAAYYPVRFN